MADWCMNRVIFYGDRKTRSLLADLFSGLAEDVKTDNGSQDPPFIQKDGKPYRHITWNADEEVLYYETWQSPELEALIEIADFYGCAFECTYKKNDTTIFNRAFYRNGVLIHDH